MPGRKLDQSSSVPCPLCNYYIQSILAIMQQYSMECTNYKHRRRKKERKVLQIEMEFLIVIYLFYFSILQLCSMGCSNYKHIENVNLYLQPSIYLLDKIISLYLFQRFLAYF